MIRQWHEFMRRPEARSRVVFLSDYDMDMPEQLVAAWTCGQHSRRPWEASARAA